MKYAVEMDSVVIIYIPSFIKISHGHSKVDRAVHTHRMEIA
jgi:hypothetical protein